MPRTHYPQCVRSINRRHPDHHQY